MRYAAGLMAISMAVLSTAPAWSQNPRVNPAPAAATTTPTPPPAPAAAPKVAPAKSTCANPDALGVGRVVEIDTTGGPGFGFEHFKQLDFLRDKEVVLTFDDGPWPVTSPAVLKALADECTKGIFFPIG
ncbi:MAG: polysaccharide deacetylase [Tardiphaga sp.]|nr:polysaccharide deacetylase [Tardiphaga sp.]